MANVQIVKCQKFKKLSKFLGFLIVGFWSLRGAGDKSPRQYGMLNCGNSCYFNSSIQLLSNIEHLTEELSQQITDQLIETYVNLVNNHLRIKHLEDPLVKSSARKDVRDNQVKKLQALALKLLVDWEKKPLFFEGRQEDAHEFLNKFIDYLTQYNNQIKEILFFEETFETICGNCGTSSFKTESSSILTLEIPDKIEKNLEALLKAYFSTMFIDITSLGKIDVGICDHQEKEKYYVYKDHIEQFKQELKALNLKKKNKGQPEKVYYPLVASKNRLSRKAYLSSISDYVIISLKRFQITGSTLIKNNTPVNFPLIINLGHYLQSEEYIPYNLSAIICHKGDLTGGHYWAYGQGPDEVWRKFNDDFVTEYSGKSEIKAIAAQEKEIGTPYILLYKRATLLPPSKKAAQMAAPLTPQHITVRQEALENNIKSLSQKLNGLKTNLEKLKDQLTALKKKL